MSSTALTAGDATCNSIAPFCRLQCSLNASADSFLPGHYKMEAIPVVSVPGGKILHSPRLVTLDPKIDNCDTVELVNGWMYISCSISGPYRHIKCDFTQQDDGTQTRVFNTTAMSVEREECTTSAPFCRHRCYLNATIDDYQLGPYQVEAAPMLSVEGGQSLRHENVVTLVGPKAVTIHSQKYFGLLPGDTHLAVDCEVKRESVYRDIHPTVLLESAPGVQYVPVSNTTSITSYSYQFQMPRLSAGNYTVSCIAYNDLFHKTNVKDWKDIVVYEVPSSPRMTMSNSNGLAGGVSPITNGVDSVVTCDPDRPYASYVSLQCGHVTSTSRGTPSSVSLAVNYELNNTICSCNTTYMPNIDKTNQFSILVQETPSITGFQVNSKDNLLLMVGTQVTFSCQARGSPIPDVTVSGQTAGFPLSGSMTLVNSTFPDVQIVKILTCADSDVYVCKGDNSVGSGSRTVKVSVRCPIQMYQPSFRAEALIPLRTSLRYGFLRYRIRVISNPVPNLVLIRRLGRRPFLRGKRSTTDTIPLDPSEYTWEFKEETPQNGILELNIRDSDAEIVKDYELFVENEFGSITIPLSVNMTEVLSNSENTPRASSEPFSFHLIVLIVCGVIALLFVPVLVYLFKLWHKQAPRAKRPNASRRTVYAERTPWYRSAQWMTSPASFGPRRQNRVRSRP